MAEKIKAGRRGQVGYGSSYRRGAGEDLGGKSEIGAVLGGQVWMIKPDKGAEAANPCLWMQAGVVNFKNCNNFYDCTTCKYDQGMKKQVEKGKQISWQDAMRRKPSLERICRHSLTRRIEKRACAYDYECPKCDFDQFFEDVWTTKTMTWPSEVEDIRGFSVPMGYYFHNGHTWARIESGGWYERSKRNVESNFLESPTVSPIECAETGLCAGAGGQFAIFFSRLARAAAEEVIRTLLRDVSTARDAGATTRPAWREGAFTSISDSPNLSGKRCLTAASISL